MATPRNFRLFPVYPTINEITTSTPPNLPSNIIDGCYQDIEHYLDVQFRLLYEDFIQPLRKDIAKLRNPLSSNKTNLKDASVYFNVHVTKSICNMKGIQHQISFSCENLGHVNWQTSKRFLNGSLLCFSSDNFETVIYACVSDRNESFLRKGLLSVTFQSQDRAFVNLRHNQDFCMVESSAFFEAYRHSLQALKEMSVQCFPFKEYIVDVRKHIDKPKYLNSWVMYDLRPLLLPFPKEFELKSPFSSSMNWARSIPILEERAWPDASNFKLDYMQYEALKMALTKEYAIIQGPPGTGKTTIGLRIIQILLQNERIWNSQGQTPILIVCYTNHALDQFLEGILKVVSKGDIIRVGSQSNSEKLEECFIGNVRIKKRTKNPLHQTAFREVCCLENSVQLLEKNIEQCSNSRSTKGYITACYEKLTLLQAKFEKPLRSLMEIRHDEDLNLLQNCKIVGMTITGAAKNNQLIKELKPPIVIVEEAAEVMEAHIITALSPSTQHLILIGDHQQLRPNPASYNLAKNYQLDISLFERMVKNKLPYSQLVKQHRMRPCISSLLVPHIYSNLENSVSVKLYEDIKGVFENMYFINHSYTETHNANSYSKSNKHEASFLANLARYFVQQGYDSSQITILATYSSQCDLLEEELSKLTDANVRVTTVDNYQGEENEIILISFVRSNIEGLIGFLDISNRICVALSRARKGLFCIGNFDLLSSESELWRNILGKLKIQITIGSALRLYCQNHKKTDITVSSAEDFASIPEGGCTKLCKTIMVCGHICNRYCHPRDKSHVNEYACQTKVSKKLECGMHKVVVACSDYSYNKKCQNRNCNELTNLFRGLVVR